MMHIRRYLSGVILSSSLNEYEEILNLSASNIDIVHTILASILYSPYISILFHNQSFLPENWI